MYQTPDGESRVEVRLHDETVWLSLDQMAELFQRNKSTISRHIKNVFEEGELNKEVVVAKYATTTQHGAIEGKTQTHEVDYYNLDMIISVGYRVHSYRGVQFRQWATAVLKEYIKKGFVLNDELLKNAGRGNYFDELLARDPRVEMTKQFFATVQNKMHYAVHGHTAAEIIYNRADAAKDFMGLTTWTGMMPKRSDAEYAKNYLNEDEIDTLNRIVNLYIDYAELRAKDHKPMYMHDWIDKLDDFLRLSDKELLSHAGSISAKLAKEKADAEYDKFKERTKNELTPVEIHFLEQFEREQKKLTDKGGNKKGTGSVIKTD